MSFESFVFLHELSQDPSVLERKFQTSDAVALIAQDRMLAVLIPSERYGEFAAAEERLSSMIPDGNAAREQREQDIREGASMKIGAFVRGQMDQLLTNNEIPEDEVKRLCMPDYCRAVFRMSLPVLKEVPAECAANFGSLRKQCSDSGGYLRYYVKAYLLYGKYYVLCNNWRENPHREVFAAWLRGLE